MRAVDTNVLVRLLTRDDPKQVKTAESFISAGAWVSHLVLAEAMSVLSTVYSLGPSEIGTAVDMLLSHKNLSLQEAQVVESGLSRFRKKPAIGFSDCLVLEIARQAGHVPLGTFDKNLGRLDDAHRL